MAESSISVSSASEQTEPATSSAPSEVEDAESQKPGEGEQPAKRKPVYRPAVFSVQSMAEARKIILTPEPTIGTEERWETETPLLAEELVDSLKPNKNTLLIDYGCGIGRLAKEVIRLSNCSVLGVDISLEMRTLANSYVGSERFTATSRKGLLQMVRRGLKVDHGYTVWVLQHCVKPKEDINLLRLSLRLDSRLHVINSTRRWVPTNKGWINDRIKVPELLAAQFEAVEERSIPKGALSPAMERSCFTRIYRPTEAKPQNP